MHDTATIFGKIFFKTYLNQANNLTIVDIGAQNVNGSLKGVSPPNNNYIGVDFVRGKGVNIVLSDPYTLPFENETVDVVVSSSCFEHSEFFWVLFNEIMRVLKPTGLLYINAPSNGAFHRYPVDCWRFYPDSGVALQNWARRNGHKCSLIESFVGRKKTDIWNDFVAVFIKDDKHLGQYRNRIQDEYKQYMNGRRYNSDLIENEKSFMADIGQITPKRVLKKFKSIAKRMLPKK